MKLVVVILSILLAAAIYMYVVKPTENVYPDADKIAKLERENDRLDALIKDTLNKQNIYFTRKLEYSDSVIKAKRINNWNLIVRHEKELEVYKSLSSDSAFVEWVRLAKSE